MRPWIEKLAKISKERGSINRNQCIIANTHIGWSIAFSGINSIYHRFLTVKTDTIDVTYKIYEDEYDLLKETKDYIEEICQDNVIEQINNL